MGIVKSQKQKTVIVKKEIEFTTTEPNGLEIIKEILGKIKNAEIKYISAGKYTLKKESDDMKKGDNELKNIIQDIQDKTKKYKIEINVKEK